MEISTRNHTPDSKPEEEPQDCVEISKRNHTPNSKTVKETQHGEETQTKKLSLNSQQNTNCELENLSKTSQKLKLRELQGVEVLTINHTSDTTNKSAEDSQDDVEFSIRKHTLNSKPVKDSPVLKTQSTVKKAAIRKPRTRKFKIPKCKPKKAGKGVVYYTNADTLSNKMNLVIDEVSRIKPHIIGITEVKPKNYRYELQSTELNIPGYTLIENLAEKGRGICLYVNENLNISETNIDTYNSEECIWVEVKINEASSLTVGCIYRSPNSSDENNLNLNKMIQSLNPTKRILMMGDFNHPQINWKDSDNIHAWDAKAEAFLESTRDAYLFQHVLEPTRHRANQQRNPLDLVFTTDDSVDNVRLEAPLGNSDHCGIIFEIQLDENQSKIQPKTYPNYNKADYVAIKSEINNLNWKTQLADKDVNESWNLLSDTLKASCKRHVPLITKKDGKKRPLWMNQTALAKVKKKHQAWKRYLETKSGELYLEYTRARNQAKWETRKAKIAFEKMLAKNVKKNPKQFWGYVNSKRKTKVNIPDLDLKNEKGSPRTRNDMEKAELLNQYFKKVFTNEDLTNVPNVERKIVDVLLEECEISQEMVEKKLKALNQNKSPGPDNLHPRILKELSTELALPISIIFQKSVDTGKLPTPWKDGHIIPIFKKGNKHKAENYRPVCLTVICCKILESILRDQILNHLKRNNIITSKQHGFLIGRSTFTQLVETLEEWTSLLDQNNNIDILYCDFKKAFDSVPHHRLMLKVKSFGIGGKIEKWIEDFITGRRQRVCINDKKSDWIDVSSGVPQGSVLGPLLFVIFINDLPDAIDCLCKMYADDTKIYQAVNNAADAHMFQENIKELWKWSLDWQLHFHPDKCHILHMGKTNEKHRYYMGAGDDSPHTHLKQTQEEKDLGVVVDNQLIFSSHCDKVVNTANKLLGIMRRSFCYLDKNIFSLVYKGIIRPIIEYASSVYDPILMKDVNKIESIQRRATKMVIGLADKNYEERLRALDLPTLRFRRVRGDMINVYKYLHQDYEVDTTKLLPLNQDPRTRGHYLKIQANHCQSKIRLHFFSQRVINKWNSLQEDTISAPSINSFKNRLDKEWNKKDAKYNFNHTWFECWRY